jgi:catechol 2,3-dioxygenase-like lactoylglutathione lyase family enzyme
MNGDLISADRPGGVSAEALALSLRPLVLPTEAIAACVDARVFRPVDPAHAARVLWAASHGGVSLELAGDEGAVEFEACYRDAWDAAVAWFLAPGTDGLEVTTTSNRVGTYTIRIGIAEVFVDDLDRARDFYSGALGFQVKTDVVYGPGARWLTVVSPRDGTELLLTPLNDAARALQDRRRADGTPAVSFNVDDCQRRYVELRDRGVVFVSEPQAIGYGRIDAVFEDGCGNLLNLHQDAAAASGG